MKKIIIFTVLVTFITSCSSHRGRVCGGPSGGRCVENAPKIKDLNFQKENS